MFDLDQLWRKSYAEIPFANGYTDDERVFFQKKVGSISAALDLSQTEDLKRLLTVHEWFDISVFGAIADNNAWLLVQHADQDRAFQVRVLPILEARWPLGETKPANYALLFDRVATSWSDPSLRQLQRYGTQGACSGPGAWAPLPSEDPAHLDERRASVGLEPEAEYIKRFITICH